MLQVLLFKTLNLLELKMLLIHITEGSSVCGDMTQGRSTAVAVQHGDPPKKLVSFGSLFLA
jgi:hypothetical protein